MSEVIDGEVVATSNATVIENDEQSLRLGDYRLGTFADVLNKASDVSSKLATIIRDRKLFKRIGQNDHVYVEGWTTCGAMLGVAVRPVSCEESATTPGEFHAVVEAIRTSDGFVLGRGFAMCGPDERDWGNRSKQARKSMAQTRAAGKAMRLLFSWVMKMAGYASTPFEELDSDHVPTAHENPPESRTQSRPQPRGQRAATPEQPPTEVSAQQLSHVVAHWKAKNPDPEGNLLRQSAAFNDWARESTGRTTGFNPKKPSEWTTEDYRKCCNALGIEVLP